MGGRSVTDQGGDLSDRQGRAQKQLRRVLHPYRPQLGAHRRTRVGEHALELAPRCQHPPSEHLDGEVVAVVALDDRLGVAEKGRAQARGGSSLCAAGKPI
jgi:hypothetical protein